MWDARHRSERDFFPPARRRYSPLRSTRWPGLSSRLCRQTFEIATGVECANSSLLSPGPRLGIVSVVELHHTGYNNRMSLKEYERKRRFDSTPEPPGKLETKSGHRFVVQMHRATRLHYDFRLELDGVLKSWAVPKGPSLDPADKRMAVEVEDHPFAYASFEGVIPEKEYGAGNVIVWDCGVYSPDEGGQYAFADRAVAETRVRAELAAGKLSFFLCGEKLKGSFTLVKTRTTNQWLLIKHQDRFAQANDVLARHLSVLSGVSLAELTPAKPPVRLEAARLAPCGPAEKFPERLAPMLAESGDGRHSDPKWRYEPKLDGYRVLAFVKGGVVRLQSRRGLDYTPFFPEIAAELATHPAGQMIVDGEIVALGADGRPSFNALQNRAQLKSAAEIAAAQRASPVVLVCFDLLHFAGLNLRGSPYSDRRRYLAQCLLPGAHLQLVHASDDAEQLYTAALEHGFEGIIAKRLGGPYREGRRSSDWLKLKAVQSSEFLIGGYTRGNGARAPLGALLLGYREGKALLYAGHVGSGLDEASIAALLERSAKLERPDSPFEERPPLHRPTTWLTPRLVAEVSYGEWTKAGVLRAPVFLRLRDDIDPQSVRRRRDGGAAAGAAAARAAGAARGVRTPWTTGSTGARASDSEAALVAKVLEQLENPAKALQL